MLKREAQVCPKSAVHFEIPVEERPFQGRVEIV
jgi:hypothetical protein